MVPLVGGRPDDRFTEHLCSMSGRKQLISMSNCVRECVFRVCVCVCVWVGWGGWGGGRWDENWKPQNLEAA